MFPPRRIVCLTEETVETLYLLGEQDRIVGVTGYAVRPPQVRREKPRVSAFISADFEKIIALKPDLVLVDITLPGKNGVEFIKDARAQHPDLRILVMSMHDESLYADRVLRAGGRGYIRKQEGGDKLIEAMRRVLRGDIAVSEKMTGKLLEKFSGRTTMDSPLEGLSDRELEVFQLIGQGKTMKEIGDELHLSPKTIEVHRSNIRAKLRVTSAAELVAFAARWSQTQGVS